MHRKSSHAGFTLVEMVITVVIMSVLAAFVVPRFGAMVAQNRLTASANELVTMVQASRMEAVRTKARVVLCPTLDDVGCGGQNWARTLMFPDLDRNGSVSGGERATRVLNLTNPDLLFTDNSGDTSPRVVFAPDGIAYSGIVLSPNNTISVCSHNLEGRERLIEVGVSAASTGPLRDNPSSACKDQGM